MSVGFRAPGLAARNATDPALNTIFVRRVAQALPVSYVFRTEVRLRGVLRKLSSTEVMPTLTMSAWRVVLTIFVGMSSRLWAGWRERRTGSHQDVEHSIPERYAQLPAHAIHRQQPLQHQVFGVWGAIIARVHGARRRACRLRAHASREVVVRPLGWGCGGLARLAPWDRPLSCVGGAGGPP